MTPKLNVLFDHFTSTGRDDIKVTTTLYNLHYMHFSNFTNTSHHKNLHKIIAIPIFMGRDLICLSSRQCVRTNESVGLSFELDHNNYFQFYLIKKLNRKYEITEIMKKF